jgi:hypothetical protein
MFETQTKRAHFGSNGTHRAQGVAEKLENPEGMYMMSLLFGGNQRCAKDKGHANCSGPVL